MPGSGGVLVPLNTRLAAADYAYVLCHSGARTVFASTSPAAPLEDALTQLGRSGPRVVWVDPAGSEESDYETLIRDTEPGELQHERQLFRPARSRGLRHRGRTGQPAAVEVLTTGFHQRLHHPSSLVEA